MRKVVAAHYVSLDGVAEQPSDFVTDWDEAVDEYGSRLISTQDAVLLGRRTYDEWSAFWPTSEIEPFATFINSVDKYVATLTTPDESWAHTTFITRDVLERVADLKAQSGNDIGVHGSIALTQSLLVAGLVDEVRLCVAPVVQVVGSKLFENTVSRRLTLTGHVVTPSGYLLLDYLIGGETGGDQPSS